jgi:hypothetical protein
MAASGISTRWASSGGASRVRASLSLAPDLLVLVEAGEVFVELGGLLAELARPHAQRCVQRLPVPFEVAQQVEGRPLRHDAGIFALAGIDLTRQCRQLRRDGGEGVVRRQRSLDLMQIRGRRFGLRSQFRQRYRDRRGSTRCRRCLLVRLFRWRGLSLLRGG